MAGPNSGNYNPDTGGAATTPYSKYKALQNQNAGNFGMPWGWGTPGSSMKYNPMTGEYQQSFSQPSYDPNVAQAAHANSLYDYMAAIYGQDTSRMKNQMDYDIAWNQGEVNKNLGLGSLANQRELGLGDINVRRDLGQMELTGTRDTNATNKQIADWQTARALQSAMYGADANTLQARIANEPALLGLNLGMEKFNQIFPWLQGMFGGQGGMSGYGNVDAAGDYGMDYNAEVVPTMRSSRSAPQPQYNPTAGMTGPNSGLPAQQQTATASAAYATPATGGTTDPYANFKPGGVGDPASGRWVDQPGGAMQEWQWTDGKVHPAVLNARLKPAGSAPSPASPTGTAPAGNAPVGNPFADKITELKQKRDQLAKTQAQLEQASGVADARGGGVSSRIRGGDFGNMIKDIDNQIAMYNKQGQAGQGTTFLGGAAAPTASPDGLVYDQAAGRWVASGSPQAPTTPANAALSASSSARAAAPMPANLGGMPMRDVNGMPMKPPNFGSFNGGTAQGPVLFDDLAARSQNAAPQYDQSPMYGASLQNRIGNIGMNAFDLEAYNAGKMMDRNRAPTGMSVAATSPYNQGMKRMFSNAAGIGKYNAGANTAMNMAQGNAQHALALGQARNNQYQNSLNYGMARRNQNLQGQQVKLQSQQPMWNLLGSVMS